jgi:hypothetical protein
MRRLIASILALSLALAAPLAAAQSNEDMYARMNAAMADAQAQAQRPGDDQLTCDQLQAEMTTTMQDPAVQGVIAQQGQWAQGQVEEMNAARGRAQAQLGVSLFMGLASSFIPGLGMAQAMQQRAMAAQQQAQAQQNIANMTAQAEQMSTIMPQMMRGQRVYELAQAQQCPFTQQQAPAQ